MVTDKQASVSHQCKAELSLSHWTLSQLCAKLCPAVFTGSQKFKVFKGNFRVFLSWLLGVQCRRWQQLPVSPQTHSAALTFHGVLRGNTLAVSSGATSAKYSWAGCLDHRVLFRELSSGLIALCKRRPGSWGSPVSF